jgi:phosphoglycolate phosphatase-like HAD superfamily hydrolase
MADPKTTNRLVSTDSKFDFYANVLSHAELYANNISANSFNVGSQTLEEYIQSVGGGGGSGDVTNNYVTATFVSNNYLEDIKSTFGTGDVTNNYLTAIFSSNNYIQDILDTKATNTYVNSTFSSNNYIQDQLDLKATNTYVNSTFTSNNYVDGRFSSNTYVTSKIGLRATNTYVNSTFVSNNYLDGNFTSNSYIVSTFASNNYIQDHVATEVAALVDSAPSTLDTLNELAAALGDDANFAATITNKIGLRATNTYVNDTFSSNNYLQDQLDLKATNTYVNSTFTSNNYVEGRFVSNTYVTTRLGIRATNTYVQETFTSNNYVQDVLDTKATNTYVNSTFTSNNYVDGRFTSNTYVTSKIGLRATNTYVNSIFTSNNYVDGRFTSNSFVKDTFTSNNYVQTQLGSKLDSSSYTASDVLTKIKTVDGTGSGLDADLLDGLDVLSLVSNNYLQGRLTAFGNGDVTNNYLVATFTSNNYVQTQLGLKLNSSSYTAADVLTKIKTVDGAGSGLNADTLDGLQGSSYSSNNYITNHYTTNNYIQTFVAAEVAGIVDSAPAALDTLNELAAALGDDANFSTTVSNQIGLRATNTYVNSTFSSNNYLQGQLSTKLNSSSYTASDVLTKIKTVDGSGSGLDADLLDGIQVTGLVSNNYAQDTFVSNGFGTDTFSSNNYNLSIFTSNNYVDGKFTSNTFLTDTFTTNNYVDGRFTSNTYVISKYASNTYVTSKLGLRATNTYVNSTFTSNSYVDGRFTSNNFVKSIFTSNNYVDAQLGLKLDSSSYTASDVLTKIKTVDGSGSGLDADTLDGLQGSSYVSNNYVDGRFTSNAFLVATFTTNNYIQSYVSSEVASLVDSAPATLDTLNELAAALGDDANFATTVSTQIGIRATNTYVNSTFSSNNYLQGLGYTTNTGDVSNNYLQSLGYTTNTGDVSNNYLQGLGFTTNVGDVTNTYLTATFSSNNYLQGQLGDKLNSSSYTASDVLTKIKTVDGSGSGLDADLLDGQHASAFQTVAAPNSPSITSTTVVNETIELVFGQSSTSGVTRYEVWSDGATGSDYSLIAIIPSQDAAASMSVIDSSFDTDGTVAYRVYAVKNGVYSTAATTTKSFTIPSLDVSNMSVVSDITTFHVQYDLPDTRFMDHIEIYKDAETTLGALSRTGAALVYSGSSDNFTYTIPTADLDKFHQFWVEVVSV